MAGVSILVTSTAFPHGVTSNQTDARFVLSDPTEVFLILFLLFVVALTMM